MGSFRDASPHPPYMHGVVYGSIPLKEKPYPYGSLSPEVWLPPLSPVTATGRRETVRESLLHILCPPDGEYVAAASRCR